MKMEQYGLFFNGEIYNFIKLRERLIKKGHQFRTKSDTEVIIHAYQAVEKSHFFSDPSMG